MNKKRILVVDDEIDFLNVIKLRLEANDYEVLTAQSGDEALKKLKSDKPDAVLLDILMPCIDGLEVLKKIRKIDEKMPVYIMTAFSTEDRFRIANKFGASGFIVKTDDLGEEVKNITSALDIASRYKGKK